MFREILSWVPVSVPGAVVLAMVLLGSPPPSAIAERPQRDLPRWEGHDFAFCFVTDDGRSCNLAWAEVARDLGIRFTIAVNIGVQAPTRLTYSDMQELASDGFEIANHSYSHGNAGLPECCPRPPRGSMAGYFVCEGVDPEAARVAFAREIERDSVAVRAGITAEDVRSFAYPRHRYTIAVIDSLVSAGYLGARAGGRWSPEEDSYGDFVTQPRNTWDGGISLFRVPLATTTSHLFGDHSANPPVHHDHETFVSIAQPIIDGFRESGGVFVLYTHHLGDHDDTYGDIDYGSGGLTPEDLRWIVELVQANNGLVMTFGEMCAYYRDRTVPVRIGPDLVWRPGAVSDVTPRVNRSFGLTGRPNPFNPRCVIGFELLVAADASLEIYDLRGRRVRSLANRPFSAGRHEVIWDGRDDHGRDLSSGNYVCRLRAGRNLATRRLTLVR